MPLWPCLVIVETKLFVWQLRSAGCTWQVFVDNYLVSHPCLAWRNKALTLLLAWHWYVGSKRGPAHRMEVITCR